METQGEANREKLGALWKKTSRKGTTFLSGTINGQRVVIFKAREKRNDKSPDFEVFLSRPAEARPAPTPDTAAGEEF